VNITKRGQSGTGVRGSTRRLVSLVIALTIAISGSIVGSLSPPVGASTVFEVAPGSGLQAAVNNANPGDTIRLREGEYTLSQPLVISKKNDLTIVGAGRPDATVLRYTGSNGRVVEVGSQRVTIKGVTLEGGKLSRGNGGGVLVARNQSLTLVDSTVRNNSATEGGGIENLGTLTVSASTIVGNTATNKGGGIRTQGSATIVNSTFVGNTASQGGALSSPGTTTVTHATVTGNQSTSSSSAGIDRNGGTLRVYYSVIGGNVRTNGSPASDCSGTPELIGLNLVSDSTGCNPVGEVLVVPAAELLLEGLADNGGPTLTAALLEGSPALDAIARVPADGPCASAAVLASAGLAPVDLDQRGVVRLGNGSGCDLGAYEFQVLQLDVDVSLDVDTSAYEDRDYPPGTVEVGVTSVLVDDIADALVLPPSESADSSLRDSSARNISARNISARNISARNISARNISARNISARNISARNISARNIALRDAGIDTFITSIPLSEIPLFPDGWSSYLEGTQYEGLPLQFLTLEALSNEPPFPMPSPPLTCPEGDSDCRELSLEDVDLTNSVLGALALRSIVLVGVPLEKLPLQDGLTDWCDLFADLCEQLPTPLELDDLDLLSVQLAGGDVDSIDVDDVDLTGTLAAISARNISARNISARNISARNINLDYTRIGNLTVGELCSTEAGKLVVDCSSESTTPLRNATILDGATVGHLIDALDELGRRDPNPLAEMSLADFLALFVLTDQAPWEEIDLDTARLQNLGRPPQPTFDYEATITVENAPAESLELTLPLPYGFVLAGRVGEVATFQGPNRNDSVVSTGANIGVGKYVVGDVQPGIYKLRVPVRAGIVTGEFEATATLVVSGLDEPLSDSASVTVVPAPFRDSSGGVQPVGLLTSGDLQLSHIASGADVDLYSFEVDDETLNGSTARVLLSNIPAGVDYDLSIYGPTSTPVRAGVTPKRSLTSLGDVRYDLDPDDDVFSTDVVGDIELDVVAGFGLGDYVARDLSSRRSNTNEEVEIPAIQSGVRYYVAVTSYLADSSEMPYGIRLRIDEATAQPECAALPGLPFAADATGSSATSVAQLGTGVNTLYLTNRQRLQGQVGSVTASEIVDAALATSGVNGVDPAVVAVDDDPDVRAAYVAWSANRCDPEARNGVVRAIGDVLDDIVTPAIENIVILGGDGVVPMAAIPDMTTYSNEATFALDVLTGSKGNELSGALGSGHLLSDDPYGTKSGIEISGTGHELYVPDVNLGRLVESGNQILQQLQNFKKYNGNLDPGTNPLTAAVTGYDFLTDGAQAVATQLGLAVEDVVELINDEWNAEAFLELFAGGGADIVSPNAHFDHEALLPAAADSAGFFGDSDLVLTSDFGDDILPDRSLLFTMGCHAGLSVSDVQLGFASADWAELFASGDNQWLAHTTYGYGDTEIVAYSERLATLFAANVALLLEGASGGPTSLGDAMRLAKQQYLATTLVLTPYDEKIMQSWTYYGLPMYTIGGSSDTSGSSDASEFSLALAMIEGTTTTTSTTIADSPAKFGVSEAGRTPVSIVLNQTTGRTGPRNINRVTTDDGDYFEVGGNTVTAQYRPVQPLVDAPIPDTVGAAAGFLITKMTSFDIEPFVPRHLRPTIDLDATERRVIPGDGSFPSTLQRVTTDGAGSQRLLVAAGQFQSDPEAAGSGRQRLFTAIDGELYEAGTNSDGVGPQLLRVDATQRTDAVDFEVQADVTATRVVVVYQLGFNGAWRSVDLSRGSDGIWKQTLSTTQGLTLEFFVQAVDSDGDVSITNNKVENFFSAEPAPSTGITIALSEATGDNGFYGGPVTVTIESEADAAIEYFVDEIGPAPYAIPFVVTGDGGRVVFARDATGAREFVYFEIDTTGPVISSTVSPAANEAGFHNVASVSVSFDAVDELAGIERFEVQVGSGGYSDYTAGTAISVTAEGTTVVTARATDRAGNVSTKSETVRIDTTGPVISSTVSPAANEAGFHNVASVSVSFDAVDELAGIATFEVQVGSGGYSNYTAGTAISVTAEGTTVVTARATDRAGNVSTKSETVRIDRTAPVISSTVSPAANEAGFHNVASVSVSFSAEDASGIATFEVQVGSGGYSNYTAGTAISVTAEGTTVVTARATDVAGNVSTKSETVRIDRTAPTASLVVSADSFLPGDPASASVTCGDSGVSPSGIAACTLTVTHNGVTTLLLSVTEAVSARQVTLPASSIGLYTLTLTATDKAGNSSVVTKTYTVGYRVCELYDWTKSQKIGSNYTIKIRLCDAAGNNLSARSILLTAIEVLDQTGNEFTIEPNFSGSSNDGYQFRYEPKDKSYIYNLKTDGFPPGALRLGFVTTSASLTEAQRQAIIASNGSTNWARFTLTE
jgi:predicted outer membrane repeat protein